MLCKILHDYIMLMLYIMATLRQNVVKFQINQHSSHRGRKYNKLIKYTYLSLKAVKNRSRIIIYGNENV